MQIRICDEISGEVRDEISGQTFVNFLMTLYVNFGVKIEKRKRFFDDVDFEAKFIDIDCFFDVANEVINSEFNLDFVLHLFFVLFKRCLNACSLNKNELTVSFNSKIEISVDIEVLSSYFCFKIFI